MDHSDTTVTPQQYVWWGNFRKDFKSVFLVVYGPCLHSYNISANSNLVRVVYVVGWKNGMGLCQIATACLLIATILILRSSVR